MLRPLTGAIVVSLGVFSLVSPAGAATVATTSATPAEVSSMPAEYAAEAPAFARERGISVDAAVRRLSWQRVAPDLAERAARDLGERFGGVWIDVNDGDRIKVGIVHGPDALAYETVRRVADTLGLTDAYDLVGVRYSAADLERHNDWLGEEIVRVNAGAPAGLTAALRTDLNAIELAASDGGKLTDSQLALLADAAELLGDRLLVGSYEGRPEAWAAPCAYPYCDPPLRGGIRIIGNVHPCTGGFIARSKINDKLYQFTAGHCAASGDNNQWLTKFAGGSKHVIGPLWHWRYNSGGDMAIVAINNVSGWSLPQARVLVTDGPDTNEDTMYHISSDNLSVIGMRICSTGSYYGRSDCGYVTHLGATIPVDGVTVRNLGRSTACGTFGDSGAPMYALHVAYGILIGGYSECNSFYQGIRAAEQKLNVDVLHSVS